MTLTNLYAAQDKILTGVFANAASVFGTASIILAGGTALARYYLNHRASYDLDFFVDHAFDPALILARLRKIGLAVHEPEIENANTFASQIHGWVETESERVKTSFIEDVFAGMFAQQECQTGIVSECLDGLYHRKLRTITGTEVIRSATGHSLGQGGRQKARDLFDLYTLDQMIEPIPAFIQRINNSGADLPLQALYQGLSSMPWLDMMDEFKRLEVLPPHKCITAFEAKQYFDRVIKELMALL